MVRVVMPQDVCQGMECFPSLSSYTMSNILPKFCPRLCEVAPWMERPEPLMYASTVVVMWPPGKRSSWVLAWVVYGVCAA